MKVTEGFNMRKIISILLIALLAAGALSGCGGGSGSEDTAMEVTVVSREDGSGTRGAFIELLGIEVREDDSSRKDMTTKDAIIAQRTDVMLTNVANDPYAIGYVSLGSLNDSVKALKIEGVEATPGNIKNGTYAISRPFNIATKGQPKGLARDFIDFIMSADGQSIVSNGYIAIDENAPAFESENPSGKLVIAGSSSVAPVMEKLIEAYMLINTDADLQMQMSDSTTGMNSAIEGICDIGMASRDLKDSELAELTGLEIALDGIAVIVSNDNPLNDIDKETVRQIFTGEVTSWEL